MGQDIVETVIVDIQCRVGENVQEEEPEEFVMNIWSSTFLIVLRQHPSSIFIEELSFIPQHGFYQCDLGYLLSFEGEVM